MSQQKTTHFGFEQVNVSDKAKRVADVFHSVAERYDLMNDLMSLGIHRLWKKITVALSYLKPGDSVLDIAAGTGDLSALFSQKVGSRGKVILSDINDSMLNIGRDRMIDKGHSHNTAFVQANGEYLPFKDNTFDCISIGFGLRNITDKSKALHAMYQVLKPGGKLLVLEFSKPTLPGLSTIYDAYSFHLLPKMGELITKDAKSYQYLAESIRMHPGQEDLKNLILEAGFDECQYINMTGGIVALHIGIKT